MSLRVVLLVSLLSVLATGVFVTFALEGFGFGVAAGLHLLNGNTLRAELNGRVLNVPPAPVFKVELRS